MKTTATLFNIIQSELIKSGKNEFFINGELITDNENTDLFFIQKAMRLDTDVKAIVDKRFFLDYSFSNQQLDKFFKRMFINRFLNREINRQTIEAFATILVSIVLSHEQEIIHLYEDYEKMLQNKSNSNTNQQTDSNSTSDNRQITAELPQTDVNLDVRDYGINFADDNSISRTATTNHSESSSETNGSSYNPDVFLKLQNLWDSYLNEIDKKCFLQIW